ncbi:unnamed protein product [Hanseniaspora opuntiae]
MSEEQKPDIKPAATDADHVSIKVTDDRVRMSPLLVFTFEGITLTPEHTPEDLAMENNDIIEVYRHQSGGYAC